MEKLRKGQTDNVMCSFSDKKGWRYSVNLAVRKFIVILLTIVVAKSYGSTLPFLS